MITDGSWTNTGNHDCQPPLFFCGKAKTQERDTNLTSSLMNLYLAGFIRRKMELENKNMRQRHPLYMPPPWTNVNHARPSARRLTPILRLIYATPRKANDMRKADEPLFTSLPLPQLHWRWKNSRALRDTDQTHRYEVPPYSRCRSSWWKAEGPAAVLMGRGEKLVVSLLSYVFQTLELVRINVIVCLFVPNLPCWMGLPKK